MRYLAFVILTSVVTLLPAASPISALEKRAVRVLDDRGEDSWHRGCSTSIAYYNLCTGWAWAWAGWSPGDEIGVEFQTFFCTDFYSLFNTFHYASAGAPSGYGFTGTMSIRSGSPLDCPPGGIIASQALLPSTGWNTLFWGVAIPLGPQWWTVAWTNGDQSGSPVAWGSDLPSAGPTGPPACGTCYPTTRIGHSYSLGSIHAPLCPGQILEDYGCAVELLWIANGAFVEYTPPVSLTPTSWGSVKALYR